jgi:pseudaminic acid cytidylyltransferase
MQGVEKSIRMNICIIPARGGSKRIHKKNIKFFLGKPIIAYSIETALNSKLFDKVIVSTDDENIAKVAKEYGAEVPFIRPEKLSDDFTSTNCVVKHAINWFLERDIEINYVCCIYATAPFVKATYLRQGLESLSDSNQLFAFSVTSFPFPIQRAIKINNGKISMFYPEHTLTRSQDLDEAYHDAGQFYWGRSQAFLDEIGMFSEDSIPVVLPRYLVQDIDTLEDWKRAELMYKILKLKDLE